MKNEKLNSEDWLTVKEVCSLLQISKRTLFSYRVLKQIPYYQVGRKIYFNVADIDEFLMRHHIKAGYQNGSEYGD